MGKDSCDCCMNYVYDGEYNEFYCAVNLDEDELESFLNRTANACPYFQPGDEYKIVNKQI